MPRGESDLVIFHGVMQAAHRPLGVYWGIFNFSEQELCLSGRTESPFERDIPLLSIYVPPLERDTITQRLG